MCVRACMESSKVRQASNACMYVHACTCMYSAQTRHIGRQRRSWGGDQQGGVIVPVGGVRVGGKLVYGLMCDSCPVLFHTDHLLPSNQLDYSLSCGREWQSLASN